MENIRYEIHTAAGHAMPFVLHAGLERTPHNLSHEKNWHENIELQLCLGGEGSVLLNGERYAFAKNDIVVVDSNVIHYTDTADHLTYTCLIVNTDFCKQHGIDYEALAFSPHIRDSEMVRLMEELTRVYGEKEAPLQKARASHLLLAILILLCSRYATPREKQPTVGAATNAVKEALLYLRQNYEKRITLDELSRRVLLDKYALCREFKRLTGRTVIESTNRYRCDAAAELLHGGCTVAEAARRCGFENLSYFTKTFRRFRGVSPSAFRRQNPT